MIERINNTLRFSFPEIHPDAEVSIDFQRTLRIPDRETSYPFAVKVATSKIREYANHDLPWFEYYDDHLKIIPGASILKKLKAIVQKAKDKKENPLPKNETVTPGNIQQIVPENRVREGEF